MSNQMSFKYKFLKGVFKTLHIQSLMAMPPEKTQKLFKLGYKGENIPTLSDPEFDIERTKVNECSVVWYKHKKENKRVCIYLVGGGMLKYPKPSQNKEVLHLAKTCQIDFVLPYYPILFTGNTVLDVYDMLYALYKKVLENYEAKNIYFLGGSSGANFALGLVSHINKKGEGLPLPGKIYAGSPGTLLLTEEEKRKMAELEKVDVILSKKALYSIWEGMTGDKEIPDYMKYLQLGDYTGLKSVYMSFGSEEVFYACADSIKEKLEKYGVDVTLEIGEGLYHSYAAFPLIKESEQGYHNMIEYISHE
jgi:acetyl esterase/lipase